MKHVALFLVLPLALASTAFAQQQTFMVNPDASQVEFALAGSHPVQGALGHYWFCGSWLLSKCAGITGKTGVYLEAYFYYRLIS